MSSILKRAMPAEINTIRHDAFDTATFETMKDQAETLNDTEKAGSNELRTFPPLMQDVFNSLYKYQPKIRDPGDIKTSHRFNHSLINKATETDQYNQLRQYTKLDDVNSALATVTIANSLVDTIKDDLKDEAEQANRLNGQEDACQKARDKYQSLRDIADKAKGQDKKKFQQQASAAGKQANSAANSLKKLQAQYDKDAPGAQQKIRQAIRRAEKDALDDIKETSEILEAWGTQAGSLQKMSSDERFQLAQRMTSNDKIKKLAKMIGRFRRLAIHSQKTKITHGLDEVYDIETGNDINRIIPAELANLRNPTTKKLFQRKYLEHGLLQYKLRGMEKAGKGPIIALIDSSGSMGGDPELWSKAVTLSLLEIAQMQNRSFAAIFFGSQQDDLKTIQIKKGEKNIIPKVVEIAEYFLGGGTDFEKPLTEAIEILDQSDFKKADIVLITDGYCAVSDEFLVDLLKVKKDKQVRIHTVLCNMGSCGGDDLVEYSDMITNVSEMVASEAVEIFEGV